MAQSQRKVRANRGWESSPRISLSSFRASSCRASSLKLSMSGTRELEKKQRNKTAPSGTRSENFLCTKVQAIILHASVRGTRKPNPGGRSAFSYASATATEDVYWIFPNIVESCGWICCNRPAAAGAGIANKTESNRPAGLVPSICQASLTRRKDSLGCCVRSPAAGSAATNASTNCCIPFLSDVKSGWDWAFDLNRSLRARKGAD